MRAIALMNQIAATDSTFTLEGGRWRGKCLICNGWLGFDARTGFGANIEHIYPRSLGGDNALESWVVSRESSVVSRQKGVRSR